MANMDFETELQAMKRMKEIDDEINIDYLLGIQELTDIERIYCLDPELGKTMRKKIILKFARQGKKLDEQQINELLQGRNIKVSRDAIVPHFRDQIFADAEQIDWDKFLLISAYRARQMLVETPRNNITPDRTKILKKIMQTAQKLIKDKTACIIGTIEFDCGKTKNIEYTFEQLLQDLAKELTDGQDIDAMQQLKMWKKQVSKSMQETDGR